ncbi:MAG: copper chaperone PCu(A)C [Betaproteobacteria bacterium]|nr:copper chaperone PCu(A)C [Betaproteobacteria bacterium]
MSVLCFALSAALLTATPALAEGVKVENAWVRATAPGQKVAGGFMDLTADADMVLTGGSSPVSRGFELHFMRMENGVMEMRPMKEIPLPKGKTVSLEPGALHVMFIGLKGQIKTGDKVPVKLTIKGKDGKETLLELTAEARQAGGSQY